MKTSKALMQYIEELEEYHEYMECYEEYKHTHPEHAKIYHQMAQDELEHSHAILKMYPELEEIIATIKSSNPGKHY